MSDEASPGIDDDMDEEWETEPDDENLDLCYFCRKECMSLSFQRTVFAQWDSYTYKRSLAVIHANWSECCLCRIVMTTLNLDQNRSDFRPLVEIPHRSYSPQINVSVRANLSEDGPLHHSPDEVPFTIQRIQIIAAVDGGDAGIPTAWAAYANASML